MYLQQRLSVHELLFKTEQTKRYILVCNYDNYNLNH